jgi:hypothetical protein
LDIFYFSLSIYLGLRGSYFGLAGGFAASRAESVRLSVRAATILAATPPEAKPLFFVRRERKAGGLSTWKAAKPQTQRSRRRRSISRSTKNDTVLHSTQSGLYYFRSSQLMVCVDLTTATQGRTTY